MADAGDGRSRLAGGGADRLEDAGGVGNGERIEVLHRLGDHARGGADGAGAAIGRGSRRGEAGIAAKCQAGERQRLGVRGTVRCIRLDQI